MILRLIYHKIYLFVNNFVDTYLIPVLGSVNNGQADYILIINSYTESTPWSRIFTTPIYERMVAGNEDIDAYTDIWM